MNKEDRQNITTVLVISGLLVGAYFLFGDSLQSVYPWDDSFSFKSAGCANSFIYINNNEFVGRQDNIFTNLQLKINGGDYNCGSGGACDYPHDVRITAEGQEILYLNGRVDRNTRWVSDNIAGIANAKCGLPRDSSTWDDCRVNFQICSSTPGIVYLDIVKSTGLPPTTTTLPPTTTTTPYIPPEPGPNWIIFAIFGIVFIGFMFRDKIKKMVK